MCKEKHKLRFCSVLKKFSCEINHVIVKNIEKLKVRFSSDLGKSKKSVVKVTTKIRPLLPGVLD